VRGGCFAVQETAVGHGDHARIGVDGKTPPASSLSEYVMVLVVASASLAAAVMPTAVLLAAFSSTALAAGLLSAGAVT